MATISENVKRARGSATIADTARMFGVSAETWSKWERGISLPNTDSRLRLADAYPLIFDVAMAAAQKRPLVNKIFMVLDRSGSMVGYRAAALKSFNQSIRDWASVQGQRNELSVLLFDNTVRIPIRRSVVLGPDNLDRTLITEYEYSIGGGTALFDAVKSAIDQLAAEPVPTDSDVSYVLMVVTDGEENESSVRPETVRELMRHVQATDRWTLTFQMPPGAKRKFVRDFGIPEGNCVEWELSERGITEQARHTTQSVSSYASARAAGARSVKNFYTTNAAHVNTTQVRARLEDVSGKVKVWEVKDQTDIRTFCEARSRKALLRGAAFYQLTKTEKKVQDFKQLALIEKGKPGVYVGGSEARRMLGLPQTGTVKVVPGNHGNYDIFIQSTSINRKLPRGTRVVYYPAIGTPYTEGAAARA